MHTVSLIEDDEDFRDLLRRAFRSTSQLRLISAYATGEEAIQRLPREKPNVVLMDIKLPGLDGIECLRRFRAISPALPTHFLMLTGTEDPNLIFDALKAGAHGYLLKGHTPSNKLFEAIKEVIAGGAPLTPIIARKVITYFATQRDLETQLSGKEEAVLLHLSKGLMYKEIAGELAISINTVRKRVGTIYDKLHVHSRAEAADFSRHRQSSPPSNSASM